MSENFKKIMDKFTTLTATAAPIDFDNVDNDQVIPARLMRRQRINGNYGSLFFHDLRFDSNGNEKTNFILNKNEYKKSKIIVAANNYACGSSRLGAVYAHYDFGIRALIANSFGDVFYNNCFKQGILPIRLPEDVTRSIRAQLIEKPGSEISINLLSQEVIDTNNIIIKFQVDSFAKKCLLEGLSDIALTLSLESKIVDFERNHCKNFSWLSYANK
jgi:3-isopropylmalate/(R)-2-methylmalate dehydratase small subunit